MIARLLCEFDNVKLRHIPREFNGETNELAQIASNYKVSPSSLREFIIVKKSFVLFRKEKFIILDNWTLMIGESL